MYSKSLSTHAEFDYSRGGYFGLADAGGSKNGPGVTPDIWCV